MMRALRRGFVAFSFATPLALASCDPCAGLSSCSVSPRVTLEGRLVEAAAGGSVSGARVDVVGAGGVIAPGTSASTTTDARGFWQLSLDASALGSATVDVVIAPPNRGAYRVSSLATTSSRSAGDATDVGIWVANPYFFIAGEIVRRATGFPKITNASVTFVRTGGTPLSGPGWQPDGFRTNSDAFGRVTFFGLGVFAAGLDDVIGDVIIDAGSTHAVAHGVHLTPTYQFRPAPPVQVIIADVTAGSAIVP